MERVDVQNHDHPVGVFGTHERELQSVMSVAL